MGHTLLISDERFDIASRLAAGRGMTPEELVSALLDAAWEAECAPYDQSFAADAGWQETARAAAAGELPSGTVYHSTEEFFRALDAAEDELEDARRLDQGAAAGDGDADVRS